jgi:uncharacterized membrane protein
MINTEPALATSLYSFLHEFVSRTKLHPVLVNFTAALVPISVASDFAGRLFGKDSLRNTGWWTLFYATAITPLTAITGWLFWSNMDDRASGMAIHKWLGTGLTVILFAMFAWRWHLQRRQQRPTAAYFFFGAIYIVALAYQGHLGGEEVFSGS